MIPLIRIWDKKSSQFLSDVALRVDGYCITYDWHGDYGKSWGSDTCRDSDDFIVQRNSGVKDIKGNWIFEGDFISCEEFILDGMNPTKHKKTLIIFKDGVFYYSLDSKRNWVNPHQILNFADKREIIGHRYEN